MPGELVDIKKHTTKPNFVLNFSEYGQIKAVHFSKYELSQNLLLLSFAKKIVILNVTIQVSSIYRLMF